MTMTPLDPNEAPAGLLAVEVHGGPSCSRCCLNGTDHCTFAKCRPIQRADHCDVFFIKANDMIDADEAPDGYVAVKSPDGLCTGCAFKYTQECANDMNCTPQKRADRQDVIYLHKTPATKPEAPVNKPPIMRPDPMEPMPHLTQEDRRHIAEGAQKFDFSKPRMELLDRYAMEQTALVLNHGAKKYAPWNWTLGIAYSRLLGAALRHIFAFASGEDNDKESGLPHLAHAMCCLIFLLGMTQRHPELDDRNKVN